MAEKKSGIDYAALTDEELSLALRGWNTQVDELTKLLSSVSTRFKQATLQYRRLRSEVEKRAGATKNDQ